MPLTRREALSTLAGAAALAALPRSLSAQQSAASSPASMNPIRHSVCKWCYGKISLEDLAVAGKAMGLQSIELLEPKDAPILKQHGLTCAVSNGPTNINEGINRRESHAKLIEPFKQRLRECAEVGFPSLIVFSGNRRGQADQEGLEICAEFLKQVVGEAEKVGVTIIMELLNSKVNHKDYQCDHTAWGVDLVKRVGSERFKLLYDIYHMQIMEGDIIRNIQANHQYIGHYHTGGNPGRNEIDETQELYYPAIMRAIQATGYKGFVGQEFIPKRDPLTSLREAVKLCTV